MKAPHTTHTTMAQSLSLMFIHSRRYGKINNIQIRFLNLYNIYRWVRQRGAATEFSFLICTVYIQITNLHRSIQISNLYIQISNLCIQIKKENSVASSHCRRWMLLPVGRTFCL